jgi:rapamycin-insensitive companion of mTOR
MRVILSTLLDGHHTLSESLVLTLLYLLDAPNTRQYLRPGVDAEVSHIEMYMNERFMVK